MLARQEGCHNFDTLLKRSVGHEGRGSRGLLWIREKMVKKNKIAEDAVNMASVVLPNKYE